MNIIFGAKGLAGSGICRSLNIESEHHYLTPVRAEVDLYKQTEIEAYLGANKPNTVIMAAGVVGGIKENIAEQANFLLSNLNLNLNLLQACLKMEVPRVLILASSCVYPANAEQPLQTNDFLKGSPEPTNAGHAIGKTTASWLIKFYRESYGVDWGTAISSNLYGLEDDFSGKGHVIPGLIRRFANSDGSTIEKIWGSASTLREFLFNDDLGFAIKILLEQPKLPELINIGSSAEITMAELIGMIAKHFNYEGNFEFDMTVPVGWPRRVVDSAEIRSLGWKPNVDLESGLKRVVTHFREVS